MKEGSGRPGDRTETLEAEAEIPSQAVPDTMPRGARAPSPGPAASTQGALTDAGPNPSSDGLIEADGIDPSDVPATRPAGAATQASGAASLDPGDFPVVGRKNYAVGEEFARGGLGRILRARDLRLERTVALKELISSDARAQARFIREAKITARLEHPNIVPIHEAGHWPDGPRFYAMKLVLGTTLASRLEDADTDEARLRLLPHLIDVADAVAYAHSQGILHRDLKPSNVMVGRFGETVLIDWGLAKDLKDRETDLPSSGDHMSPGVFETSDGIVVGTPPYMPPEQAMAKSLDERADVYALGAMLYHVLSGRRPYYEAHPKDILSRVVQGPPVPLEDITSDLAPDLLAIVSKAMARSPSARYRSAEEMAEELRRFTAGRLVRAHVYSSWQLVQRFVRRNLGIVATALVAMCGLMALGWWSYVNIGKERDIAQRNARLAQGELEKFRLEKARVMLASDPTEALAWLKRLPPLTPQAATTAAEADDLGVARLVMSGHSDVINAVAVSADGRWGASVSTDRTVRLWDLARGRTRKLQGHTEKVTQVAFSPDGDWLATGSHDRTVRLWSISRAFDNDTRAMQVLTGATGPIKALAFEPAGATIAAADEDGQVFVWSFDGRRRHHFTHEGRGRTPSIAYVSGPQSGAAEWLAVAGYGPEVGLWSLRGGVNRWLSGPTRKTAGLAVSPDGRSIAAGAAGGPVRIWSLDTGRVRMLPGRTDRWTTLVFSSDGRRLAAAGIDRHVRVWSLPSGRLRHLQGHDERITKLVFSPSGESLLSASWDSTVRVWTGLDTPMRSGSIGQTINVARVLLGHSNAVSDIALSEDGTHLLSGSWDQTVRLWRVRPQRQRVLRGHTIGVHGLAFDSTGRRLYSGGHDKEVRAWDFDTREATVLGTHEDHIYRVQVSPDGLWVASSSDDRSVRLWNVETGAHLALRGHVADVEEIAFSADGRWLVSAGEDAMAWLWSIPSGSGRRLAGHGNDITDVTFHPDSRRLATSSRDGTVRVWHVDGRLVRELRADGEEVWSVAFSPDGNDLAAASADGKVRVYGVDDGVERKAYRIIGEARQVRFSPDGAFVAVATSGRELFLCRRAFDFCDELQGHGAMVHDIAFSPDGTALVTGAGDSTVRVYDVETMESRVYRGHAAPVFDVDVSPDGRWIASGSADADIRVWSLRLPPKPDRLRAWLADRTRRVVE